MVSAPQNSLHGEASLLQGPAQFLRKQMCPTCSSGLAHLPPPSVRPRQSRRTGPRPSCGSCGLGAKELPGCAQNGTSESRGRRPPGRLGEASKVPFPSSCPESRPCGSQVGSETKSHPGEAQAVGCRHTRGVYRRAGRASSSKSQTCAPGAWLRRRGVAEDRRGRQAPTLQGAQRQACRHARDGRKGRRGSAGGRQEAASWGPLAGWVTLLLGEGLGLSHPGQGWKPRLGDPGAHSLDGCGRAGLCGWGCGIWQEKND